MPGQFLTLAAASSDLTLHALTRFPKILLECGASGTDAAELSRTMQATWNNPTTQQLLRREAAEGWPPEYQ